MAWYCESQLHEHITHGLLSWFYEEIIIDNYCI